MLRKQGETVKMDTGGSLGCLDKFNSFWWQSHGTGQGLGKPWLYLCSAHFQHHCLFRLHLDVGLVPGSIIVYFQAVTSKQPFVCIGMYVQSIYLLYTFNICKYVLIYTAYFLHCMIYKYIFKL